MLPPTLPPRRRVHKLARSRDGSTTATVMASATQVVVPSCLSTRVRSPSRSPFLLLLLLLLVPRATTSLLLCTGISMPVRVECLVAMGSSDRPSDVIVRNRGTVRRLPRILRSAVTLPFSLSLSLSLSLSQRTTLHYPHQPTTNQSTTCYATGQLSLSLSPRLCGVKLALSRLLEFVSLSLRFNGARSFISLRIPYPSIVYISIDVPFLLLYLCMYMYVIMHPVPNVRCCDHSKFATTARGRLHTSEGACASLLFVSFRCRCRCHHGRRRLAAAIALDSSSPSSISLSLSLSLSLSSVLCSDLYVCFSPALRWLPHRRAPSISSKPSQYV